MNPHFASLVIGIAQQAQAALDGKLPGAEGKQREAAQALIDTLGMLEQKTAGRLEPEEAQLLSEALTPLRIRFVQTASAS